MPASAGMTLGGIGPCENEASKGSGVSMRSILGLRCCPLYIAPLLLAVTCAPAIAQQSDLSSLLTGSSGLTSGRVVQLVLALTVLSVAPGILVMVTCFTRFIIALSFLRSGLGLPSTPANLVLISLALFMTLFTMGPPSTRPGKAASNPSWTTSCPKKRRSNGPASHSANSCRPMSAKGLDLFAGMSGVPDGSADAENAPLRTLIPAFMISELRRGFEIGFLIILPFLVIDLITATLTMSMGMMMLSPATISLPFKILFFILIDGWNLLVGGLLRSFH